MNDIAVSFPGGKRFDARIGALVVHTDQPVDQGGEGTAIAPFDLFLASLATCAGLYVLGFCQARGLSTDRLALQQRPRTTKRPVALCRVWNTYTVNTRPQSSPAPPIGNRPSGCWTVKRELARLFRGSSGARAVESESVRLGFHLITSR
jgi:hypothetical protein